MCNVKIITCKNNHIYTSHTIAKRACCNAEIANPRPKASGAKAIRAQQMQAHEPKQVGSYDNGLALRVSIPGAEFLRWSYVVNL
jgi:hypothetical protein